MHRPSISVVMPIYNRAEFVGEAIDSVLAQTYGNWELILADDGSTDGSIAIARDYAERFPGKIKCVAHENGANRGISATRNLGFRASVGEYIACLDSDDIWVPRKLEHQVAILAEHPGVGLVVGATNYWYPENSVHDKVILAGGPLDCLVQPPALFSEMYPLGTGVAPSMNTVLLRRDVVTRVGGWEESFRTTYEDQAMLCKIYLVETVYISSEVGDIYRQHPQSIMSTELFGTRYYRKRYLFLRWLERWFMAEYPNRPEELALIQQAVRDPRLRPYRGPVRYTIWRSLKKLRRIAGRIKRLDFRKARR